ncbi:hypothetical protein ABZ135_37290 [Streptomyces sp. NPDC006339]|uniref:hypothetical protein n=1 Tax=Streptomyces sp. NPDC006339 TaxID=3156755 RepID=UPI0033A6E3D3
MRQKLARAATVLLLVGAGAMGAAASSYAADDSGWGTPPSTATSDDSGWGSPAPSPTPEPTATTRDSGWG